MDGNGRWAQAKGLRRLEGHKQGADNVRRVLAAAREHGVRYLTLYAFSVENWNRPKAEVDGLMSLLKLFLKQNTKQLIKEGVALRVIGRIASLPKDVQELLKKSMDATAKFADRQVLCLALNYGARSELEDAVRLCLKDARDGKINPDQLSYADIAQYLYTKDIPDPDLVIRTSGEYRLSNFLLLQSAYAEWYFTDKLWPDFNEDCFREAIADFQRRERRFGMTGEQIKSKSKQ